MVNTKLTTYVHIIMVTYITYITHNHTGTRVTSHNENNYLGLSKKTRLVNVDWFKIVDSCISINYNI